MRTIPVKASTFIASVALVGSQLVRLPLAYSESDLMPALAPQTLSATEPDTQDSAAAEDDTWPRTFTAGEKEVTIYQPQVERWEGNRIEERAAISIRTQAQAQPTFGVIWLNARTDVNKENHLVTLEDVEFTKASFPSDSAQKNAYLKLIKENAAPLLRPIAFDRLQASLTITKAESERKAPDVKNDPPRIVYSSQPALLVQIDGEPVLRETGENHILRVVNSRALILIDSSSGSYYLYLGDRWMKSGSEAGPWIEAKDLPPALLASLDRARQAAVADNAVDLQSDAKSPMMEAIQQGSMPKVITATSPTELVETQGTPQFEPVANTRILYVKNTAGNIFMNTTNQKYYLPISGRWFRSSSLDGPWQFVAANQLPPDFAKIPENHPKGAVLASVAGTPQAKEAEISNDIPQTATVDRQDTKLSAKYDGAPEFKPIAGTPLFYAVNSAVPVIEIDPHTFYSVQNGVWFVATSAEGPWAVATSVPSVIYAIPPSSPLYYVTYVYVYGFTPRYVYAGYLPGYLGSYVAPDGVVVFGTGYVYHPWIGTVWYGAPVTYGFGVSWGVGFGWGFHVGVYGGFVAGPCFTPWWGPWGWGWRHGMHTTVIVNHVTINHTNVYGHWSPGAVHSTSWSHEGIARHNMPSGRGLIAHGPVARPNNIYSDHQGNVFRHGNQGWERYGQNGWQHSRPTSRFNASNELERERTARSSATQRFQSFRQGSFQNSRPNPSSSSNSRRRPVPSGRGVSGGRHFSRR